MVLEAEQHARNAFVTLTYSDEHMPKGGSLDPTHLRQFLKSLRTRLEREGEARVRFFGVGEYGERSSRPHYHLALFNYDPCPERISARRCSGCPRCLRLTQIWGKGLVDNAFLTADSAAYIAGYVAKKMTAADDPRLQGRHPEFARMSRRPGIGVSALHELASMLLELEEFGRVQTDVPVSLQFGGRHRPLGRTLRRKLREMIGRSPNAPREVLEKQKEELQIVREALIHLTRGEGRASAGENKLRNLITEIYEGEIASIEAREAIHKKRGSL